MAASSGVALGSTVGLGLNPKAARIHLRGLKELNPKGIRNQEPGAAHNDDSHNHHGKRVAPC